MRQSTPAPVMTDVARLAGVSHQTVSRVVNDSPHVSGPTRAKVLAAMEQLGYRRNGVARALARRRSSTLGVITFDTVLYGPVSTLYSIEQAASSVGLGVTIAVVEQVAAEDVVRALARLQDQSVEGVIALAPQRDAVDTLITALRSTPSVFVGGVIGGSADDSTPFPAGALPPAVGIDQRGGGAAATRHLLDLGHRTVHHLAGPQDYLDALWRTEGWRDTLTAAAAPVPPPQVGDWSSRSGYAAMRRLLAADPALTAVFVGNDQMALGALRALEDTGHAVPRDVSVVGFDDIPEAEFFGPPLTTVRQGFTEAGRRAVAMLMDLISPADDGAPVVEEPLVRTELLVRSSTGPAPARPRSEHS